MGVTTDPNDPGLNDVMPDGQMERHLVLSDEEIAKGYVCPVRYKTRHIACGGVTNIPMKCAETYARDPKFYGGTFCAICQKYFPLRDAEGKPNFLWDEDNTPVGECNPAPEAPVVDPVAAIDDTNIMEFTFKARAVTRFLGDNPAREFHCTGGAVCSYSKEPHIEVNRYPVYKKAAGNYEVVEAADAQFEYLKRIGFDSEDGGQEPPPNPSSYIRVIRGIGFDTNVRPDKTEETMFFLREKLSDDPPGLDCRKIDNPTEEEVNEFIAYYENQINTARNYLLNGGNPRTHEWLAKFK